MPCESSLHERWRSLTGIWLMHRLLATLGFVLGLTLVVTISVKNWVQNIDQTTAAAVAAAASLLAGFYLTRRGQAGPLYWAVLWGAMTLLAASVHLPLSEQSETMSHIINPYPSPIVGWIAFLWLTGLVVVALLTCVTAARVWSQQRREISMSRSSVRSDLT